MLQNSYINGNSSGIKHNNTVYNFTGETIHVAFSSLSF